MVFARNISRIVRPTILGRCINPTMITPRRNVVPIVTFSNPSFLSSSSMNTAQTSGITEMIDNAHYKREALINSNITVEAVVDQFAELCKKAQSTPIEQFEETFKLLSDLREGVKSYEYLKKIKELGIKPTNSIYSDVVRSLRRTLRPFEVRVLFGEALENDEGKLHSPSFDSIKEVAQMMEEDGAQLTDEFYIDLANHLSNTQNAGLLINVSTAMEKRGRQPPITFYNKMILCLPKSRLDGRADILFNRMVTGNLADQQTYIYRITSLVQSKRLSEALLTFNELKKQFGLNEIAANSVISGYLQAGKYIEATSILAELKAHPTAKPTSATANTFVDYFYANDDNITHAAEILDYFRKQGYPFTAEDQGHLFKLYARRAPDEASRLLETAMKSNPKLHVDIYNSLLSCMMDRMITPDLRNLFVDAVMGPEVPPVKPHGLAAACNSANSNIRKLIAKMEDVGIEPNSMTFELCMRSLRHRGDPNAVIEIYRRVVACPTANIQHSHRNYYLEALLKKGSSVEIENFIKSMIDRRQPFFDFNLAKMKEMGLPMPNYSNGRTLSSQYVGAFTQTSFASTL